MKLTQGTPLQRRMASTLPEVLVSIGIIGIMVVSLLSSITQGFVIASVAEDNSHVSQALVDKCEVLRLYSWTQFNETNFVPTSFKVPLDAGSNRWAVGTIKITNPPFTAGYSNTMKQVHISVTWTNSNMKRTREMTTYVSENGIQNYVY